MRSNTGSYARDKYIWGSFDLLKKAKYLRVKGKADMKNFKKIFIFIIY